MFNLFKSIKQFILFNQNFIFISLIFLVLTAVWGRLPQIAVRGDGFVELLNRNHLNYFSQPDQLFLYGVGAVLLGELFTYFFGVNLAYYRGVELFFIFIISISFYYLLITLTKKKFLSFIITIMFSLNYIGNFEMYAGGIYAYFLERIPNVIFLILSLAFLHKFLESEKIKFYITSIILFFLGIGLAHFGVLFTGPYIFYPVIYALFNYKNKRRLLKLILVSSSYLAVTGFFAGGQKILFAGLGPSWTFRQYLFHPQIYQYPRLMLRELVYWSELPALLYGFKGFGATYPWKYPSSPILQLSIKNAIAITNWVVIVYTLASAIIFIKLPKFRVLLVTILLSVLSVFYLNAYFDQYPIDTQSGAHRYLYFPTFLLTIFWGLFIYSIFWLKKGFLNVIGALLLFLYLFGNLVLINDGFQWLIDRHKDSYIVWNYIVSIRPQIPNNSVVVIPNFELGNYEGEFLTDHIGYNQVKYIADVDGWEKDTTGSAHLIKLEFKRSCECVTQQRLR